MTCDFSDAERVGFELDIHEIYDIDQSEDIPLENYYQLCEVHIKRSVTRVCRNGAIVTPDKEMEFYSKALGLLNPEHTNDSFLKLSLKLET
jgi:hypothetical protein